MVLSMKVVHLIPAGSAFTLFVRDQASKADQSIMEYTFLPYMGIIKPELFWSLFKIYFLKNDSNDRFTALFLVLSIFIDKYIIQLVKDDRLFHET